MSGKSSQNEAQNVCKMMSKVRKNAVEKLYRKMSQFRAPRGPSDPRKLDFYTGKTTLFEKTIFVLTCAPDLKKVIKMSSKINQNSIPNLSKNDSENYM